MSKEEKKEKEAGRLVSARCHCPNCGKTYVINILMTGVPKKGAKSGTPCRVCLKHPTEPKTVYLIFDRKY